MPPGKLFRLLSSIFTRSIPGESTVRWEAEGGRGEKEGGRERGRGGGRAVSSRQPDWRKKIACKCNTMSLKRQHGLNYAIKGVLVHVKPDNAALHREGPRCRFHVTSCGLPSLLLPHL